jgi:hypothetical protein
MITVASPLTHRTMGRPRKFNEDLVKREVLFPTSLSERLDVAARRRGVPMADLVRDAVERDIENAAPATPGAVVVPLSEVQKRLVTRAATSAGYEDLNSFLSDLLIVMGTMPPDDIKAVMNGGLLSDQINVAAQAHMSEAEKIVKKSRKKSAA